MLTQKITARLSGAARLSGRPRLFGAARLSAVLGCAFLFSMLLCHSNPLLAQDSLLLRDYRYLRQSSPWLTQRNAAALSLFDSRNIAEADLSLSHASGSLTGFSGSPSLTTLQVAIESFYRISPRAVVFGAISYDNLAGDDMTGSVFLQDRLPFDIVEDSLTNKGHKHCDSYHLTGGFSYSLTRSLALGLRADYTAANYAKYKDLRHKNKLMNLDVTAGLLSTLHAPLSTVHLGLDYTYHRRTESLQFATYGKSDKLYKSLIDYGAMMGVVEMFGNEGYTDKTNEMPLAEDGHSGALSFSVSRGPFMLYNALSLSHATGYYGRKSQYTITYTDHDRDIFTEHVRLAYTPSRTPSMFCLDLRYANEKLHNRVNTFRGLTNANGATHYVYYDATDAADKRWRTLDIDYTMHLGIRHELPLWTVTAGCHWQQRDVTAYLYPYYRQQQLRTTEWTASLSRHIVLSKGVWLLSLAGGYQQGSGDAYRDGTFVTPSAKQSQPATMPAFLYQDYQYLTAPQYRVALQLKYTFLFPGTRLCTHVRAAFDYRRATVTDDTPSGLHNPSRTVFTIAAGHTF